MDAVNYISLLITTLTLVTVALLLVIGLYIPPLVEYRALTVTLLAGSVGLALWCVWDIIKLEDVRSERSKDDGKSRAPTPGCPNHYIKDTEKNECVGKEVRLDPARTGMQNVYKFPAAETVSLTPLKGLTYKELCDKPQVKDTKYPWTEIRSDCDSV